MIRVKLPNRFAIRTTIKPVLSDYSKLDKTKVLMVKSIAECALGAFCNTFDMH